MKHGIRVDLKVHHKNNDLPNSTSFESILQNMSVTRTVPIGPNKIPAGFFRCTMCTPAVIFEFEYLYIRHLKVTHGLETPESYIAEQAEENSRFVEKPFICFFCPFRVENENDLKNHIFNVHQDGSPKKALTANRSNTDEQVNSEDQVSLEQAEINNVKDKNKKQHGNDVIVSYSYACKICPFKTSVKRGIARHFFRHKHVTLSSRHKYMTVKKITKQPPKGPVQEPKSISRSQNVRNDKSIQRFVYKKKELRFVTGNKLLRCGNCGFGMAKKSKMGMHLETCKSGPYRSPEKKSPKKDECHPDFKSQAKITKNHKIQSDISGSSDNDEKNYIIMHPCCHCSFKCKKRGFLGYHMRKKHPQKGKIDLSSCQEVFACKLCPVVCKTLHGIRQHCRFIHSKKGSTKKMRVCVNDSADSEGTSVTARKHVKMKDKDKIIYRKNKKCVEKGKTGDTFSNTSDNDGGPKYGFFACTECLYTSKMKNMIKKHIHNVHKNQADFVTVDNPDTDESQEKDTILDLANTTDPKPKTPHRDNGSLSDPTVEIVLDVEELEKREKESPTKPNKFKCTNENCSFVTDYYKVFCTHMQRHVSIAEEEVVDYEIEQNVSDGDDDIEIIELG